MEQTTRQDTLARWVSLLRQRRAERRQQIAEFERWQRIAADYQWPEKHEQAA